MTAPAEITLRDNAEASRFEILSGDEVAGFASYSVDGDVVTMPHTVVAEAYDGQGLGGRLVSFALDAVREQGRRVRPVCPFVKGYIERHEDYADLVV